MLPVVVRFPAKIASREARCRTTLITTAYNIALQTHLSIDEIIARHVSEYNINQAWIKDLRAKFPYDEQLMRHLDEAQERSKGYEAQIQLLYEIRDQLNKTKGELYHYIKIESVASGLKSKPASEEGWLILANGAVKTNYVLAAEVTDEE